ncbi:hypothetical protein ACLOJK_027808 [Asimina triloba]
MAGQKVKAKERLAGFLLSTLREENVFPQARWQKFFEMASVTRRGLVVDVP